MTPRLRTTAALIMLAGVSLVAAEPAYVGKWKFNAARSQLSGDTVTISSGADGLSSGAPSVSSAARSR